MYIYQGQTGTKSARFDLLVNPLLLSPSLPHPTTSLGSKWFYTLLYHKPRALVTLSTPLKVIGLSRLGVNLLPTSLALSAAHNQGSHDLAAVLGTLVVVVTVGFFLRGNI